MAKYFRLTALVLSTFLFVFSVTQIKAQTTRGITITPPKYELFANPGDQVVEQIKIKNDSDSPQTYEVIIEDFTSTGEEGQVTLNDTTQSNTQYSLAQWLEPETKDLILQPFEERSFSSWQSSI
jgi:hypothetical protein